MAATMKDIARRTGLGLATISSYFNGGNVREKNRIKIEEAIQELHYEVNEVARGLKTNATKTIGVVIPELIGTLVGKATEDLVNEKLGEYDEKVGAIIEKYVKYAINRTENCAKCMQE